MPISKSTALNTSLTLLAASVLTACGGGSSGGTPTVTLQTKHHYNGGGQRRQGGSHYRDGDPQRPHRQRHGRHFIGGDRCQQRAGHQLGEHSTRMRPSPAIGRSDRNYYPVKSSNQRGGPLFALIAVNERWRNPLPKSADFSLHHAQQVPRRASSVLCMREYTPREVRR